MAVHEAKCFWHDLIEDPNDLPLFSDHYYITAKNEKLNHIWLMQGVFYNSKTQKWSWYAPNLNHDCFFGEEDLDYNWSSMSVLAWMNINEHYHCERSENEQNTDRHE